MNINIKLKDLPKKSTNKLPKILEGIPEYLKNYDNFFEVERKINEHLLSSHKHKSPSSYVKCAECQEKRKKRTEELKNLGFKSFGQYLEWKKIMLIIKSGKVVL